MVIVSTPWLAHRLSIAIPALAHPSPLDERFFGSFISRNNRRAGRDMRSPRGVASPIVSRVDRMKAAHPEAVLARRTHRNRSRRRSRSPPGYPRPICPRLRTSLSPRRSRTRGKPGNSPQHRHHSEDRRRCPACSYVSQQLPQNFTAKVESQHDSSLTGVHGVSGSLARGLPIAVLGNAPSGVIFGDASKRHKPRNGPRGAGRPSLRCRPRGATGRMPAHAEQHRCRPQGG